MTRGTFLNSHYKAQFAAAANGREQALRLEVIPRQIIPPAPDTYGARNQTVSYNIPEPPRETRVL